MIRILALFFCFLMLSFSMPLHGIIVPSTSAGVVERQIEREYDVQEIPPEREIPLLEVDIPEKKLHISDGETVQVCEIELECNTILTQRELQTIYEPYLHRELSMREIHEVCIAIQQAYLRKGYFLARTYCPEQTISDCVLTIRVLEGYLRKVKVRNNRNYQSSFIKSYFNSLYGKPINYNSLLKTLFLLNENMDLNVGAIFTKGKEIGTVDLIIEVRDHCPLHFGVNSNNYGSPLNTVWRTGARLDVGNVLWNGDQFSATQVVGSPINGLLFTNVVYKTPLNRKGAFLSLAYLYSNFKVSELRSLRLKGRTDIGTIRYDQALTRTRTLKTDLFVEFDIKQVQNFSLGKTSSFDKLRVLLLGYTFDHVDAFRGRDLCALDVHLGIPDILGGSPAKNPRSSRQGAGGYFLYATLDYTRVQGLFWDAFFLFHASGQYSPYKLPLSEQIYIGGFDTVRGYDPSVVLGDSGYYINGELRFPPPFLAKGKVPMIKKRWKDFLQFVGFVDFGEIFLVGGATINQPGSAFLAGAGVGVRLFGPIGIDFSCDVAFPLTDRFKTDDPFYYLKLSWQFL